MDISANIKAARTAKGVSQAELSRRLDLDPSSYHRLENRGKKLSFEQLESIANALDISLIALLTWGEEKELGNTVLQKEIVNLREENEELQRLVDLQNELNQMRKLSAKRYYDDYIKIVKMAEDNPSPDFQAVRLMVEFIAILGGVAEDK